MCPERLIGIRFAQNRCPGSVREGQQWVLRIWETGVPIPSQGGPGRLTSTDVHDTSFIVLRGFGHQRNLGAIGSPMVRVI